MQILEIKTKKSTFSLTAFDSRTQISIETGTLNGNNGLIKDELDDILISLRFKPAIYKKSRINVLLYHFKPGKRVMIEPLMIHAIKYDHFENADILQSGIMATFPDGLKPKFEWVTKSKN